MIIRCSNCNTALVYDIESGKMKCGSCDSLFEVSELKTSASEEDMMEGAVYACTACGAKVMVNNVECATHCAYCGQPTVIFERVSKVLKPHKILPFSITKKEAVEAIRQRMNKGFFIPWSIKHFKIERIVPIYVPFWLCDVKYQDNQVLTGKVNKYMKTFYRKDIVHFDKLTVDASFNFCDETSERLEPFKMGYLKNFHEGYLSGFYADCYDETVEKMKDRIFQRCKGLYDKESVNKVDASMVSIESSNPDWKILKKRYTMLPAWFLTFRYKKKPYTILVNGQTGKVVGSVPYVKTKVVFVFLVLVAILLKIVPKLCSDWMVHLCEKESDLTLFIGSIVVWLVAVFVIYAVGADYHKSVKKHIKHASDKKIIDFSKDREKR